jgi:hypothetical protein
MTKTPHLGKILDALKARGRSKASRQEGYAVPSLWLPRPGKGGAKGSVVATPEKFFAGAITEILRGRPQKIRKGKAGSWTRDAVIYNMFVRTTCAFDHNRNGRLDLPVNGDGWRETGTFLKALALLPYIRSLGVNTIHLLPITSIGADGNKGSLGSPYAIRNPYDLDPNLAEPNLGLGAAEEFKAFVEGAHRCGIRVVVEFVFRTAAKDGDWVREHPEWFYWIKADVPDRAVGEHDESKYGNPSFTPDELHAIRTAVEENRLDNLPGPHETYRGMFTRPPNVMRKEGSRWIGVLDDGTRVRIPGAFADWPPDDGQPPWGDVTYLKMYDHQAFNYIAYNTIRMYDRFLAQATHVNTPLWEKIAEIIPYYRREFGIDGVMIDMGHALPMELKHDMLRRARDIDPDFAFWAEDFSVTEQSVREGYNAVIGYQWSDQHYADRFTNLLRRCATEGFPLPFFATPESHNTPRAAARPGGIAYAKYAWASGNFLPAIPFIHSGFELGEEYPINTGLDFSKEDLAKYPSERLPLFAEYAYHWETSGHFVDWIRTVANVRAKYLSLVVDSSPRSFHLVETPNRDILAFRRSMKGKRGKLLVVANSHMAASQEIGIPVRSQKRSMSDLLARGKFRIRQGHLTGHLSPGQVCVFEE